MRSFDLCFFQIKFGQLYRLDQVLRNLKNKNIKEIMNKPLIAHSIISAVKNKKLAK